MEFTYHNERSCSNTGLYERSMIRQRRDQFVVSEPVGSPGICIRHIFEEVIFKSSSSCQNQLIMKVNETKTSDLKLRSEESYGRYQINVSEHKGSLGVSFQVMKQIFQGFMENIPRVSMWCNVISV